MSLQRHREIHKLWKDKPLKAGPVAAAQLQDVAYLKQLRVDKDLFRALIVRFQDKEPGTSEIILKAHEPMLTHIIGRHCKTARDEHEDLLQVARLALLEGCARFRPSDDTHGALGYIWLYVKSYVCRSMSDEGSVVKIPTYRFDKKRNGLSEARDGVQYRFGKRYVMTFSEMADETHDGDLRSFEDTLTDERPLQDEILDGVWRTDILKRKTRQLLGSAILTKREIEVLHSRFDGQTLHEIGDRVHLSRERIRQIEKEALQILHRFLKTSSREEES
jgi:RNA polymerase sigma factor (sigma-70 family)